MFRIRCGYLFRGTVDVLHICNLYDCRRSDSSGYGTLDRNYLHIQSKAGSVYVNRGTECGPIFQRIYYSDQRNALFDTNAEQFVTFQTDNRDHCCHAIRVREVPEEGVLSFVIYV